MRTTSNNPLVTVAIYLRGADLDPVHVSKILGVRPSSSQKRGDFTSRSKKFVAKIGVWTLKAKTESRPIQAIIDDLLEEIRAPRVRLDGIKGVEDAHLDVFIAFDDGAERALEFSLGKDQLAKLCQLGLSAVFTVH